MSVESEIYSRLTGFAGLTALVSSRIYPNLAPQKVAFPYVTYRRVSSVRESGMGDDIGIVSARFQFDVFSDTYLSARNALEQVRQALQRWRAPSGNPEIIDSLIENDLDTFEPDPLVHHVLLDALIYYRE